MLGHYQFRALPRLEQAAYINRQGAYLATRFEDGYVINLYHLDTFFAEAWHVTSSNHLHDITTFTKARWLNPYLEAILLPLPKG